VNWEALRIGSEGFAHAEILHGLAVLIERLPGGQSGNVMRGAVVRHRCGFPFLLRGLPLGHFKARNIQSFIKQWVPDSANHSAGRIH
jgi:hypothetical protein